MQLFFIAASLALGAHAQQNKASFIGFPKSGATVKPGQNITIQVVRPVGTSMAAGFWDVGVAIGMVACKGSCPAPSANMGEMLYAGPLNAAIHDNTMNAYQNFSFIVPQDLSGPAEIQYTRYYINTIENAPSVPATDFDSVAITVGTGTSAPSASQVYNIHPWAANTKCVGIVGGTYANGSPVDIYDCNGSASQKWQWDGSALRSTNPADQTQWCLDAGDQSQMANGVKMKIWQCFSGLTQQTWISPITSSTSSGSVKLSVGGFCLDLTNGSTANQNVLQIWGCLQGNANQVWNFVSA